MACIFCGVTENLTDEHVFPAFTGANLVVPEGSCKKCNGECGKFENILAAETETARHIFEIPNRYGRVPTAPVKIEVQGAGLEAVSIVGRRTSNGDIQPYDFVAETKTQDGKRIREGFFVSKEGAENFIQRSQTRGEKVTELDVPKEVTLISSTQQTIEFAFCSEIRKTAAKIALVSVAYQYGTDYARLSQFDVLRRTIFGPGNELALRIFANDDFARDYISTPKQHGVRTYLSAGMHKGWSLVSLFGGLSYAVELTSEFHERESRSFSLFYDTDSKTVFNPVVLYSEQEIIGRVLSPTTVFERQEAVDAQWYPIVERYCKDNDIELSRIMPS